MQHILQLDIYVLVGINLTLQVFLFQILMAHFAITGYDIDAAGIFALIFKFYFTFSFWQNVYYYWRYSVNTTNNNNTDF